MHKAVVVAMKCAIKKIKAGVRAQDVHSACTESLIKSGYEVGEKGFIHNTGHGLGLEIHEQPFLGAGKRSECTLTSGNVITVEPGLYYPKIGGVRVEDVFLVTKSGSKNLTNYSRELKVF